MTALAPQPGESVLDIGCGGGKTALDLARAVAPDGTVVGIDLSAAVLAFARRAAKGCERVGFNITPNREKAASNEAGSNENTWASAWKVDKAVVLLRVGQYTPHLRVRRCFGGQKVTPSFSVPLVNAGYVQMMARYNAEMNRRTFAAAQRLSDADRREQRGAFWGSIHGTLCHLLWGDQMWMSRFDGWVKPSVAQKDSANLIGSFDELRETRSKTDAGICEWAARVSDSWLQQHQSWFSVSVGREMHSPRSLLVAHFFNHQTHHRGQAHAMITAAGEDTGDTDLFLLV